MRTVIFFVLSTSKKFYFNINLITDFSVPTSPLKRKMESNIPTKNYYEALSVNNTVSNKRSKNATSTTKSIKPPPVIITDSAARESIMDNFNKAGFKNFLMKNLSIGTKLLFSNQEDYEKCINQLKQENVEFFTHNNKLNKIFKTVLHGLPDMDTSVIMNELKNKYNLNPTQITQIKSKFNNKNNSLYLLHFCSSDISIGKLSQIKSIQNIIVSWKKFIPKKRGPTQCLSCCMYGHGTSFCNRKQYCIICANQHHINNCPFKDAENIDSVAVRCYNCFSRNLSANHRADDINCPSRINYLNIKNKFNQSIQRKTINPKTNFNLNDNQTFPQLPNQIRVNPNQYGKFKNDATFANQIKNNNQNQDDLFSIPELFKIFSNAVSQLKKCSSKLDQIQVIASLLQYGI